MGYTVELEEANLECRSRADAEAALAIIQNCDAIHPDHLQVSINCRSFPENESSWYVEVDGFQGDCWHESDARELWLAIAPHIADGATIEFRGEEGNRWRIRWQEGRVFEEYVNDVVWAIEQELTPPQKEIQS